MSEARLIETLKADLCASFEVRAIGPGRWNVRTPLLFDDGDALPVFVSYIDGQWSLTDLGGTVSHSFFDEFQFTDARFERVGLVVSNHGAEFGEYNSIDLPLGGPPTPFDVGIFLQIVAQVQAVAVTSRTDRDQSRYVKTVQQGIESRLLTPDFDENWSPEDVVDQTRATYRADLRIGTSGGADVVVFAASTTDKANVSALTIGRFQRVRPDLIPVLAFHPARVASSAIYRFQDEVQDDDVVIPVNPGSYRELTERLRSLGVEITEN